MERWVCLDVGETLIDETRVFTTWADVLGVPAFTLMAVLGATLEAGRPFPEAFDRVAPGRWRDLFGEVEGRYGGFKAADLYPDALRCLHALPEHGYRVAVVANQPARRHAQLQALGVDPEVMAMSETMGVAKPDPDFFWQALQLMGGPRPADVAYVGDRIDNDVRPAAAAGLRAVWLRRGPWGHLQHDEHGDAVLTVDSLDALLDGVDGLWDDA